MAHLTAQEVRRLTLFKWVYSLESAGFTTKQARALIFMRWLVRNGRLGGDTACGAWCGG